MVHCPNAPTATTDNHYNASPQPGHAQPICTPPNDNGDDVDATDSSSAATFDNNVDNATNGPTIAVALSVLDQETGKFLKHQQLCRDPKHKPSWDTSYANEIGR